MPLTRGDVGLANVQFITGAGSKRRPVLVVQSDHNNVRLQTTIIALITSNLSHVHEPTEIFVDVSTSEGAATGLLQNSAVKCENLLTVPQTDVTRVIGKFSPALMQQIDDCLKAALGM